MRTRPRLVVVAAAVATLASCVGNCRNRGDAPQGTLLDRDDTLAPSDALSGQSYFDHFEVPVRAGDRVVVSLTSNAFDPILQVTTPAGFTAVNDDYRGDRRRSQIELFSPTAGTLKVRVSSYAPGATGPYHIQVQQLGPAAPNNLAQQQQPYVAPPLPPITPAMMGLPGNTGGGMYAAPLPVVAPSGARTHHQLPAAPVPARTLAPGETVHAALAPTTSVQLPSGELADAFQFEGHAGQPVTFQMNSTALDPYLVVVGPAGERWDNDDAGGTTNAAITVQPAQNGAYRVYATTYRAGMTGAYELKYFPSARPSELAGAPTAPGTVAGGGGAASPVVVQGSLAEGDARLRTGEFQDSYSYTWPVGTAVHLEARSNAFDTYLIVRAPSGHQQDNDDGAPGSTNAALDLVATEAGAYQVIVTSYRAGEVGPYELVLSAPGTSSGTAPATPPAQVQQPPQPAQPARPTQPMLPGVPPQPATPAQQFTGELAQGDRRLRSGEFTDSYTLAFRAGEAVRLRASSTAFDTYLIVRSPSGHQQDNDDLVPGSTDAGIDIPLTEAGNYEVMVTSYRPGETGAYTLRVERGGAGAPGLPGLPGAGGRVWGVFAGITDYPPGVNDLPECANDARKMVETLTRRGLLAPDRYVLLTDAQATTGAIRQAMGRMAQQVGPDDVFIFFYSGHGGHTGPGSHDPRELDGVDEYIYLYDGQLLDDEMGTLFDGLHGRIAMLALDSCFAGGFAKDVITRPGRMGLFSSEEDVTSDIAPRFQAGGYLSHFLRTGMDGEGDNDPHDNVLTVGELTHYVWRQFGANASNVRQSMGYQQLVIDRGAVGAQQMLWTYAR